MFVDGDKVVVYLGHIGEWSVCKEGHVDGFADVVSFLCTSFVYECLKTNSNMFYEFSHR